MSREVSETIEQSANTIWGMARDLAQERPSGTPLNCERNVKYIVSVLAAYAVKHAEASIVVMEVMKVAGYAERIRNLQAEVKKLKEQLGNVEKGTLGRSHKKKPVVAARLGEGNHE